MIKEFFRKLMGKKEPVELSYSRIQSYKKCPWLFKLVYMDGMRSSPNGSMSLGMSLHRALANYLGGDHQERSLDRLFQIYDEVWVNEGFANTQETLDSYDAGRRMLQNFFEIDRLKTSTVIATEKNFFLPLDGIKLMGSIDRIDKNPDGSFEIIEYKTQADNWSPQRMGSDLQLTLYEIGAEKGLALTPVHLRYFFLSNGTSCATTRSEEQKNGAMDLVFEISEKIRSKHFEPNYSYCERCEFARRCANYKPGGKR